MNRATKEIQKFKIIYSRHPVDFMEIREKLLSKDSKFTTEEKLMILYRNIKRVVRFYEIDMHHSSAEDKTSSGINRTRSICVNALIKIRFYQDYNLRRKAILKLDDDFQELRTDELLHRGFNTLCFLRNSITSLRDDEMTELVAVHPSSPNELITKRFVGKPIESKIFNNLIEYEMYKIGNSVFYDPSSLKQRQKKKKLSQFVGELDATQTNTMAPSSILHAIQANSDQPVPGKSTSTNHTTTASSILQEISDSTKKSIEKEKLAKNEELQRLKQSGSSSSSNGGNSNKNNNTGNRKEPALKSLEIFNLSDLSHYIKSTKTYYTNDLSIPSKAKEFVDILKQRSDMWYDHLTPLKRMVDPLAEADDRADKCIGEPVRSNKSDTERGKELFDKIDGLVVYPVNSQKNANQSNTKKKLLNLQFLNSNKFNSYRYERDLLYFNETNKLIL